jgi:hypothetical protein
VRTISGTYVWQVKQGKVKFKKKREHGGTGVASGKVCKKGTAVAGAGVSNKTLLSFGEDEEG